MPTASPVIAQVMSCPKCGHATADISWEAAVAPRACSNCKGIWFERGQLAQLAGTAQDIPQFGAKLIASKPTSMTCPSCRRAELMEMPYVNGESLLLDWCRACGGMWLNGGENLEIEKLREDLKALAEGRPRPSKFPAEGNRPKGAPRIPYDNFWVNFLTFPLGLVWGYVALNFAINRDRWNALAEWFQRHGEIAASFGHLEFMRSGAMTEVFLGCFLSLGFYCELPRRTQWDVLRFFSLAAGCLFLSHALQTDLFLGRLGLVTMGLAYLTFLAKPLLKK